MKPRKYGQYQTKGEVGLNEVLPLLGKRRSVEFFGVWVRLTSERLLTYTKGTACAWCGMQATHFAVQHNGSGWHLNLWCLDSETGFLTMMTSDHIKARYNGGVDTLDNRQPMCAPCNSKKQHYDVGSLAELAAMHEANRAQAKLKASAQKLRELVVEPPSKDSVKLSKKQRAKAYRAATAFLHRTKIRINRRTEDPQTVERKVKMIIACKIIRNNIHRIRKQAQLELDRMEQKLLTV